MHLRCLGSGVIPPILPTPCNMPSSCAAIGLAERLERLPGAERGERERCSGCDMLRFKRNEVTIVTYRNDSILQRYARCPPAGRYAIFSPSSMARLNRSVAKRSWQPGQHVPGFLNQLAVLLIFMPHLGQVTVMTLSALISSP